MGRARAIRLAAALGAVALLAASLPALLAWRHEAAWQLPAADRKVAERALADGAAASGHSVPEFRRETRPKVVRRARLTCVTLRSGRRDDGGSFFICYSGDRGRPLFERLTGPVLGASRPTDRLRELLW